jgi:hypothetical protein
MALAQEAEPRDPLRECWLTHERLRYCALSKNPAKDLFKHARAAGYLPC